MRTIEDRFSNKGDIPYDYEILYEINTNLYEAVYIEKELHYDNINFKYEPLIKFDGHTECFSKININKILNIKNDIETFKLDIIYKTNCHIDIDNIVDDIRRLTKEQLIPLMVRLNLYRISAKDLGLTEEFNISGYKPEDWITDLKARLDILSKKDEERKLKAMEEKLDRLLSDEKKTELELDEIENMLK